MHLTKGDTTVEHYLKCLGCQEQLPESQFHRRAARSRGRAWQCKACVSKRRKLFCVNNHESVLSYWRLQHANRRTIGIDNNKRYRQTPEGRRSAYRTHARARQNGSAQATSALRHACDSGKVKKPDSCADCGEISKVEGHHFLGYAMEHYLVVEWLCRLCHCKRHRIAARS